MLLWIAMAVVTAAASIALLAPLFRTRETASTATEALAIYRDQLDEVGRDVARGTLAEAEAGAARTEISRRMLRADNAARDTTGSALVRHRIVAAVAVVGVPLVAVGAYMALGSPTMTDRPLAVRLETPDFQDPAALIAILDRQLAASPDDAEGWRMSIPLYLSAGRFDTAAEAYANVLRLRAAAGDPEGQLGIALGEAITRAEGTITPAASRIFALARVINPESPELRIYRAAALTDGGDRPAALEAWRAVVANAPADAPWLAQARQQVAALEAEIAAAAIPAPEGAAPAAGLAPAPAAPASGGGGIAIVPEPPAGRGPTPAEIAAAAALPGEQQQAMINGMVERLAARLATQPDDPAGWAQLVNSYVQLGRTEDARKAVADARLALAGRADALKPVEDIARQNNIE